MSLDLIKWYKHCSKCLLQACAWSKIYVTFKMNTVVCGISLAKSNDFTVVDTGEKFVKFSYLSCIK